MQEIDVIAVGKLKERFWEDACAEYVKRLRRYARISVEQVPDRDPARSGGDAAAREREGADIFAHLPADAYVVALDREGVPYSSEEIAALIERVAPDAGRALAFVIGGSTGLAPAVLARADERISLGKITLPHNLARVVVLEQIYRGFKISRGEPYHK